MTETAASAGVDVSHVSVDRNESSGVGHITLEVSDHGAQNRITVCPGANFTPVGGGCGLAPGGDPEL